MWITANTQQKLIHKNFRIEIGRIEIIRNDLESGQRDLSIGDIGIRVCDLKMRFGLGFRI